MERRGLALSPFWRRHRLADKRTVLVPDQWNGSVQQYYHFLLGYLLPIYRWTRRNPGKPIAVRDCGPMNRWFDLLRPQTDIEIMHVGDVLHVLAGNLQPNVVLPGMDDPSRFSGRHLREFSSTTREIARERLEEPSATYPVIVSDRASHDAFFATSGAEWPESGSQKRSVPNLAQIVGDWGRTDVHVLDGATTGIYEQIALHDATQILIGQHGAGLTNMIWMRPGSCVIEILPPMPDDAIGIFSKLARALDIHHSVVRQESVHAPIDGYELTTALQSAEEITFRL